jgi:peroxiredoxin
MANSHKFFLILSCLLFFPVIIYGDWEPDVRLTYDPMHSILTWNSGKCIAVNDSFVHVVWTDDRTGSYDWEIYYKRSTDYGITWSEDIRLTNTSGWARWGAIAVSGSIVHVVWEDIRTDIRDQRAIYYRRSTDAGLNWDGEIRLTAPNGWSYNPAIAVCESLVFVVFEDDRDGWDIYYAHSTDAGTSWEPDAPLTYDDSWNMFPSVGLVDSFVHVVWMDNRDGNWEIYYKRSSNGGRNWSPDTRLTYSVHSSNPCISTSDSFVYVVWYGDYDGNSEICFIRSTNTGVTWDSIYRLTINPSISAWPSVAGSSGNVHIVWNDDRDGNMEVYYKKSTDGGENWSLDTRLTDANDFSVYPSIAISGFCVHVVWQDSRDGDNSEIYYKRDPSGNSVIEEYTSTTARITPHLINYPNPFSSSTTFLFNLPVQSFVSLKIYDIQGREVENLVCKDLPAGNYRIYWEPENLSSGVYFCNLRTSHFVDTRRLVLFK